MQNTPGSISNWDGQLPPHIAKNEEIWWEVFPRIRPRLPSKLAQFFGGARESPSREIMGKVMLVADTKDDLRSQFGNRGASLLNDWGCYCQVKRESLEKVYMAGTTFKPMFVCEVSYFQTSLLMAGLRFVARVDPSQADRVQEHEQARIDMIRAFPRYHPDEVEVPVRKFQHGSWENGLDIAFKACIWICSNREDALKSIWGIQV